MNANIEARITEQWAQAQARKITWNDVYKRLAIYFETMVVMRQHESASELIFLMEITCTYTYMWHERKRQFRIVR